MSAVIDFIQLRGEYASLVVVGLLLWAASRPIARLLGLSRGDVTDVFWNAGVAFLVAGRLAYVALQSPRTLFDPLVLIRLPGGVDPLAGALAVAAVIAWRQRRAGGRWLWATVGASGLAVATVGYDLACLLRDACYGTTAPSPFGFRMSGFSEPRLATPLIEAALLLALLAVVVAFAGRLRPRAVALLLVGVLPLVRAALTPASALGTGAVGVDTAVLVALGAVALVAAGATYARLGSPDVPRL